MAIDATVAGATANSYLTVAAADALAADDMGPEVVKWQAATTTTAEREVALKRATREIDDYLRTGYAPYSAAQALRFPRARVDVISGAPVIPKPIGHATYYLAAFLLLNAAVIARRDARKARGQSSYSEPNTSGVESEDATPDWPDRVMRALAGFAVVGRAGSRSLGSVRLASGLTGAGA